MNLLLDTHALIWYIAAIKNSLGRLDFKEQISTIFDIIEQSGFEILPINVDHILKATSLPFIIMLNQNS